MLKQLLTNQLSLQRQIHEIDRVIWELLKKYRTATPKRYYKILKSRLHEHKTLETVAKEFGVTKERIRQIEELAINSIENTIQTKSIN